MTHFLLKEGVTEKRAFVVSEEQTARYLGSGKSAVLATPALVMEIEKLAQKMTDEGLPDDWQSVGSLIELRHHAMTPVGAEVSIQVTLSRIEGKALTFTVHARDESGDISDGIHKRILSKTVVLERLLGRKKVKENASFPMD